MLQVTELVRMDGQPEFGLVGHNPRVTVTYATPEAAERDAAWAQDRLARLLQFMPGCNEAKI